MLPAIGYDVASLGLSVGGDTLIGCIPQSLGLCGGGSAILKTADSTITALSVIHTADMIAQGKGGPVDAAVVGVTARFSTRPVVGQFFGVAQLLYDFFVDPLTPGW